MKTKTKIHATQTDFLVVYKMYCSLKASKKKMAHRAEMLVAFKKHTATWREFLTREHERCDEAQIAIEGYDASTLEFINADFVTTHQEDIVLLFGKAKANLFSLEDWLLSFVAYLECLAPPFDCNEGSYKGKFIASALATTESIFDTVKSIHIDELQWIDNRASIVYNMAKSSANTATFLFQIMLHDQYAHRAIRRYIRKRFWAINGFMSYLEMNLDDLLLQAI
jgi:hypothetical protein